MEMMLNRFNRLMGELARGVIARTTFLPWEVDVLLDIQRCALEPRRRSDILRQYQRAVERQMEAGQPGPPMRLSQFLLIREQRAAALREIRSSAENGSYPTTPVIP